MTYINKESHDLYATKQRFHLNQNAYECEYIERWNMDICLVHRESISKANHKVISIVFNDSSQRSMGSISNNQAIEQMIGKAEGEDY